MNEVIKDKAVKTALHFWYVIVILVLIIVSIALWQTNISTNKDLESIKSQLKLQEDIEKTEARLNAMKQREAEYLVIQDNQDKLNKTLVELEKRQKELQKQKRSILENEIKNLDINGVSREFSNIGISSTTK